MNHSKEEIEYAFETFVEGIQNKLNEHYAQHLSNLTPPTVSVRGGSKYWKVVTNFYPSGYSAFGFVRKEDGAILKPASWRAPFVKGPLTLSTAWALLLPTALFTQTKRQS